MASLQGWFDLASLDKLTDPAHEDRKGLVASANAIQALVAQHSLDLDPKRVVIGGFSQGCAIALLAGLTKGTDGREKEIERNLAGVVGSFRPDDSLLRRFKLTLSASVLALG